MPIQLRFLGIEQPPLHAAVRYLLERYGTTRTADLSKVQVAVPGGKAGRRLLELLVVEAERRKLPLTPPRIETLGSLPETLYRPKLPFASELVQHLAWARCLRESDTAALGLLVRTPPEPQDTLSWLELGQMLARLHTELAADGFDFSDVIRPGDALGGPLELQRWQALERLQQAYLGYLDHLKLWDVQTARRVAIANGESQTDHDIVLVGTADMTVTLRRMLDQVAEHVVALVFAPESWATRFDTHGCLIPEAWSNVPISIADDRLHLVEGPEEEADGVARCLASYNGRFRSDQITVGLANEAITPFIQRQLRQLNVPARAAAGTPVSETGVVRLLTALQAYVESQGYPEFAALVRHPQIFSWIRRQQPDARWLERLDNYFSRHLQSVLGGPWLGDDAASESVAETYRLVSGLVSGLSDERLPVDQWCEPLREILRTLFGDREWDRQDPSDRLTLEALGLVNQTLVELEERIPSELRVPMACREFLRLVLGRLRGAAIPEPADPSAIELLGWLELPWDDAPAMIICSFNEGYVPQSVNADAFLPNALRTRIGLEDNQRRYARDAYALSVVVGVRPDVDLIVAKRNRDGDPLPPSRLLFVDEPEKIAMRATRLFRPAESVADLPPLAGGWSPREESEFRVPLPERLDHPPTGLPVTAFRDYLACPYRFYLRRILRLQTVDDAARELDGGMFGSLLHEVLNRFGQGPCRDSADPEQIAEYLEHQLADLVREWFGENPLASVRVQWTQLRRRLKAFAGKQAEWTRQGWRIAHTEVPTPEDPQAKFDVDGEPIELRGRIDRIDIHRDTGETFIWDYKSSDSGKTPEQVHQTRDRWVDLQLPLYRHLAAALELGGAVGLGYILLPKDTRKTEFRPAAWTAEDLQDADAVARDVVRSIRKQDFWPPTYPPPDFSQDFARICQDESYQPNFEHQP